MTEKNIILSYFCNNFLSRSWIRAVVVPLEMPHWGIQLSCFYLCEIRHGLDGTLIFVNLGMRNLEKHLFRYALWKASSQHLWKDAFRDSLCLDLQIWTSPPNHEESCEAQNTKVATLNKTFPKVWISSQSNFWTQSYRKDTVIFSFSLSFLPISL